jgi:hypothetical protein
VFYVRVTIYLRTLILSLASLRESVSITHGKQIKILTLQIYQESYTAFRKAAVKNLADNLGH